MGVAFYLSPAGSNPHGGRNCLVSVSICVHPWLKCVLRLKGEIMQKINPFLWFDNQAEEAMKVYTSIFKNSRIGENGRYRDAGAGGKGSVLTIEFRIEG